MAHNDARHKKAQRCVNACCSPRHLRSLKPTPRSQPATKAGREKGQEERDPLEWNQRTGVRKKRQEQVQVGDNDGWINPPDHLVISCEAYPVGKDGRAPRVGGQLILGSGARPATDVSPAIELETGRVCKQSAKANGPTLRSAHEGMRGRKKKLSKLNTAARSTKTKTHV